VGGGLVVAQADSLGPKVGGRLALFSLFGIHHENRVNSRNGSVTMTALAFVFSTGLFIIINNSV